MELNDIVFHKELGNGVIVATHKTDKLLGDKWVRVKFDKKPSLMYNMGVNPYVVEVVKLIPQKDKPLLHEDWRDMILPDFKIKYTCDKCNGYFSEEQLSNHVCDARIYNQIRPIAELPTTYKQFKADLDKFSVQEEIEKNHIKYWHNGRDTFYVENPSDEDVMCIIESNTSIGYNTSIGFRFCAGHKYDLLTKCTLDSLKESQSLKHLLDDGFLKRLTHQEFHDYIHFCGHCYMQFKTKEEAINHHCHTYEEVKINLKTIPSYIKEWQGKTKQDKKEMIKKCMDWWDKNPVKGE